jgi:prepilin-type N-terminal cleavage/methylation domain-containing protein
MKRGFTMIELIFVIVILGILAAVAIPKMAATRDDAKVSSIVTQVNSAIQEIPQYITSKGGDVNATPLDVSSQVLKQMIDAGKGNKESNTSVSVYGTDGSTKCLKLETNSTDLKVVHTSNTGSTCAAIQTLVREANYTIAGSSVTY